MHISRKTRSDLHINTIDELIVLIQKIKPQFKRIQETNKEILNDILSMSFNTQEEFKRYILTEFKSSNQNLFLLGWTDEEMTEKKIRKSEERKTERERNIIESGLSKEEYNKRRSTLSYLHWMQKGYSEQAAKLKVSEIQSKISKKAQNEKKKENSPRTLEYWIKKGVPDPEQSRTLHQRESSMRCVEYWLKRGCSYDEAVQLVSDTQRKSANLYYSNTTQEERRSANRLCREYWELKGLSDAEITKQMSDNGRTFSLELCIKKYGEDEGFSVWQKRQELWQSTLQNKSAEEIQEIRNKQGSHLNVIGFKSLWHELNIPGVFYIIDLGDNRVKIGITSKTLEERYGRHISDKYTEQIKFDDIHMAFQLEQVIKRQFSDRIFKHDYGVFGWTEVLNSTTFSEIRNKTTELLNNQTTLHTLFEAIRK